MPDIFGNQTPLEAQMALQKAFQERQAQFASSNMSNSPGAQAGQALANIFAPSIKRMIDTSRARKAEVASLLAENENMSTDEAKQIAKQTIKPEFREVRRARRIQDTTSKMGRMREQLLNDGIDEGVVEVATRMALANELADKGFANEAQQMRQQAIEMKKAEEERLIRLDNVVANTESTRVDTYRQSLENLTDTDLYVNMDMLSKGESKGAYAEVRLEDIEERDRLDADPAWIKAPRTFLTAQIDTDTVLGRKPVPPGVQENLTSQLSMLGSLQVLRAAVPFAGVDGVWPTGPLNKFRGRLGFGPDEVVNAVAVEDKMAADIQSIIKGIPSNYDASVFEKMIPRLGDFKNRRVYEAKIDLLEEHTRSAIELTLGFYKGTRQEMPQQIVDAAAALGVNTNDVDAWDEDMIERKDEFFKAHQEQGRSMVQALEEDNNEAAGPRIGTPKLRTGE